MSHRLLCTVVLSAPCSVPSRVRDAENSHFIALAGPERQPSPIYLEGGAEKCKILRNPRISMAGFSCNGGHRCDNIDARDRHDSTGNTGGCRRVRNGGH